MADSLSKLKAHLQAGFSLNPSPVSFNGGYVAWRPARLGLPVASTCSSPVPVSCLPGWFTLYWPLSSTKWHYSCAHWEELRSLRTLSLHPKWLWSMLFLLNGFFSSHSLDFMFITKYWTKVSDRTPFSELVSSDCIFFNYPHPNRRGGVD